MSMSNGRAGRASTRWCFVRTLQCAIRKAGGVPTLILNASLLELLVYPGLPRSAARLLREAGVDTVHVGEIGYSDADDASILKRARDEERTVATLGTDFHALLALSR